MQVTWLGARCFKRTKKNYKESHANNEIDRTKEEKLETTQRVKSLLLSNK